MEQILEDELAPNAAACVYQCPTLVELSQLGRATATSRCAQNGTARSGGESGSAHIGCEVPGRLTLDHSGLMVEAATAGPGTAYLADRWAAPLIATGALALVLEDWCPSLPVAS
jgi:DNA-binding transcriptional LysR family regulator